MVATGLLLRFFGAAYICITLTKNDVLITDGPYAFIRNPEYFGNILIYIGIVIAAGGLLPHLLWIAVFFFAIQYISLARYEEKLLADKFGEEYKQYLQSVPRFYPRLSPYPERNRLKGDFNAALRIEKNTLLILIIMVVLFELRWNFITI